MTYLEKKIKRVLENVIEKVGIDANIAIYPMGYYGKIIKDILCDDLNITNIISVDNYCEEFVSLDDVMNPEQYSWIISCEDIDLQNEMVKTLNDRGIKADFFYVFPSNSDMNQLDKCPICQSDDIAKIQGRVYRCNNCSHAFKKYVDKIILDKYFDKAYWQEDKNRQGINSVSPSDEWNDWLYGRMKILDDLKILDVKDPSSFKILEFGCSEGMMLYELKKRGFSVKGNDVCAIQEESEKKLGIEISTLPIEEFAKTNETFDLIMSFHCVEHLRNPLEIMKDLVKMLNDDGIMLMHVPIDDQEFDNADHYHFFTKESGIKLLENIVKNVKCDVSYYNINESTQAAAGTFIGVKK